MRLESKAVQLEQLLARLVDAC